MTPTRSAKSRFAKLFLAVSLAAVFIAGCATIERAALPEPTLLAADLARASPSQNLAVDHAPWDAFLARYVSTDEAGINRVDYAAVSSQDRAALDAYLAKLERVDVAALTRDQQLAFWINLYNAETVALVLDAYPVASIRDIEGGLLRTGPWNEPVAMIDGRTLSLNDIEHRIIRPVFGDPRIHYALNCAAAGCPNLAKTAWRAEGLDAALEAAEIAYVNDPRGVSFEDDALTLSKIFVWFREDFGEDEGAILRRLSGKAAGPLKARLAGRSTVDRYAYDWSLNDRLR